MSVLPRPAVAESDLPFPWLSDPSTVEEPAPVVVARRAPSAGDVGLLVARIVLGAIAVLDGARELFDLPHGTGAGRAETVALLASHGFSAPAGLATVLGWTHLVGGVLVLLGVFASFAAASLLAVAVTAVGVTAPAAVAAQTLGPAQAPLLGLALAAVVVLAGPGRIAADAGRVWARRQTPVGLVAALLGVGVGLTVLLAM